MYPVISKKNIHTNFNELDGFVLLIDKQPDWTSFDVVKKLRYMLQVKKVGHAGTLDPFATGLLIVAFKKATKTIVNFQDMPKKYLAEAKLGEETETYDTEGKINKTSDFVPDNEFILSELDKFKGEIYQTPPMYSALKINGKKLYELARKGIEVERKQRKITIYDIADTTINFPFVKFTVKCSKGTYIRSIAHDLGENLNCFAHLNSLRRLSIGDYNVDDAFTIDEIVDLMQKINKVE